MVTPSHSHSLLRKDESMSLSRFSASNVGYCAFFYLDLTLLVKL